MGSVNLRFGDVSIPMAIGALEALTLERLQDMLRAPRYLTFCSEEGHGFELREVRGTERHVELARAESLVDVFAQIRDPHQDLRALAADMTRVAQDRDLCGRAFDAVLVLEEALRLIGGPRLGFLAFCHDPSHGYELRSGQGSPPEALARGLDLRALCYQWQARQEAASGLAPAGGTAC